jgi:hypothetical protein
MRISDLLVLPLLLGLTSCRSSPNDLGQLVPPPQTPSMGAVTLYEQARVAAVKAQSEDLCPSDVGARYVEYVNPYLRDAKTNDSLPSPFLETARGDALSVTEGPKSDSALEAYESSLAFVKDWWPPGWLGVARNKAARGDMAGAEEALRLAEAAVLRIEERVVVGADLPRQRSFFEVIGLLPPPKERRTGNAESLELYFAMFQELERWDLPLPSVATMSNAQLVRRLKSRIYMLRSELRAEGVGGVGPSVEVLDIVLASDPNFVEARFLKAQSLLARGDAQSAWAIIAPFVAKAPEGSDFAVTNHDARFLRLAATIARRFAAEHPGEQLHGNDPVEVAEQLYTQVVNLNPKHGRACLEAAENLLAFVEGDRASRGRYIKYVREYLDRAKATGDACVDSEVVVSLENRLTAVMAER